VLLVRYPAILALPMAREASHTSEQRIIIKPRLTKAANLPDAGGVPSPQKGTRFQAGDQCKKGSRAGIGRSIPIRATNAPDPRPSGFFLLYNIILFVMVTAVASQQRRLTPSEENRMSSTLDFRKVSKNIKIFAVVQFGLLALLVYMAVNFQQKLRIIGREYRFMHGVIASFVIQLLLFYPIYKFAAKDADRDLYLTGKNLTKEEIKVFSKKKRYSDIIKISTIGFFVIFIVTAPGDPFILSIIFYSFILTILTYLQCYNFAAKKLMKEQANPKD
jgi:hypothetical protein